MESLEENRLPEGWVWTTLEEIRLDKKQSIVPNKTPDQTFELYSVPNFAVGKPEIVVGKDIGSNKQVVEEDTVLLCKINPRINRVWIVDNFSSYQKIASTEWIPFAKLDGFIPKYLCYFMQNNDFRDFLMLNVSGVGGSLMRIKPSTIIGYPIPLSPLPEQHHIVTKIEELFTQLDAGVGALTKAKAQLKRYRQSVLKSACEGRLVPTEAELARAEGREYEPTDVLLAHIQKERRKQWEAEKKRKGKKSAKYKEPAAPDVSGLPELPEGWIWATVEQLGDIDEQAVLTGPFGSNLGRQDFIDSGVPVLTIGCLTEQGLSLEKAVYVSKSKASELERYKVKAGDILFSRMATVGRAGLVSTHFEGAIINYHLMRLRLAVTTIDHAYFITHVRGSKTVVDYIKEVNHGATRDGINTSQLLILPVALPPLPEQHRIVAEIERRFSVADETEKTVDQSLKQAERLRQSILKKAFEGKLVPQDLNDEPASVLLEQIKKEKKQVRR